MNRYLTKIAEMSEQTKDNITHTAVLGGLGGLEGLGLNKLFNHAKLRNMGAGTKLGIGTGVTLGVDYAGVRLGHYLNNLRKGTIQNTGQPK